MYVNWLPTYSVEVKEIDEQHKNFVLLINDLHDSLEIGCVDIVLSDTLGQLASYADYHFATEEKYFDQFGYERAEEHKGKHNEFRAKVKEFQINYLGKEDEYAEKTMEFMKKWLTDHIMKDDQAYVECFKDNGLS